MRKATKRKPSAGRLVNPVMHALLGAAITDTASLDKLRTLELTSLEAIRTGAGTRADWNAMADMMNLAEVMAKDGIGPEVLPVCEQVQDTLMAAHARLRETGRFVVDGPGLNALRDLYQYHDMQRSSVSRSQYERSITKTVNKIRGASPELKVLA